MRDEILRLGLASAFLVLAGLSPDAADTVERRQAAAPPPPSAQPPEQPPVQPTFRVEANYVRVDVYVTKNGAPVTDLAIDDFEVLEDGTQQRLEAFERVEVRAGVTDEARVEPQTVGEGLAMAKEARSRVFVLFLDTYHASVDSSHRMRSALATMVNRLVGPEDLFAVMTPEMPASEITFARRTTTLENDLSKYWTWGRRSQITRLDPVEELYQLCYPETSQCGYIARDMMERRREQRSLGSLTDLVRYLGTVREERKAVIAVSEGWRLFRPDRTLAERTCQAPTMPGVGVAPGGRIVSDGSSARGELPQTTCDMDRIALAQLDNDQDFRTLLGIANRSNVSFYPLDPRGLPAVDRDISDPRSLNVAEDQALLRTRIQSLQTLAGATDGLAVVNSNDIEGGLKRVVDDLTSYYLLGYYSTNARLDGKYRSLAVRVKRPGVEVRARRGYLAATEEEVAARRLAEAATAAPPSALQLAIESLGATAGATRTHTAVGWLPAAEPAHGTTLWVTTELDAAFARGGEWQQGGGIDVQLLDAKGKPVTSKQATLAPGARTLTEQLDGIDLAPGEYVVRLRLRPTSGGLPYQDSVRFALPSGERTVGPARLLRRGPSTAHAYVATSDRRFRRNERMRIEIPLSGSGDAAVSAEVLDRAGNKTVLPVATSIREDADHPVRWATAEVAPAALAPADYAVRVVIQRATRRDEAIVAFRVVQ